MFKSPKMILISISAQLWHIQYDTCSMTVQMTENLEPKGLLVGLGLYSIIPDRYHENMVEISTFSLIPELLFTPTIYVNVLPINDTHLVSLTVKAWPGLTFPGLIFSQVKLDVKLDVLPTKTICSSNQKSRYFWWFAFVDQPNSITWRSLSPKFLEFRIRQIFLVSNTVSHRSHVLT